MKTKTVITVLLIPFILASCAPATTAVPTKTAILTTSIPVSSATPTFSPPTQTPAPTANKIESHFVVYSASSDETSVNTYLVNTNSGENQQITKMEYANYPSWSPDGKKIVFSSHDGLYFLNIDNKTGLTKIVDTTNFEINPIWSSDGSKLHLFLNRKTLTIHQHTI